MKINFGALLTKWCTALVCAAIYFHHVGMYRIVPILFVGTVERYGVDRNKASFPYFLRMTIAALMGPITGYLGCMFRFDHLIMLGCLVSALGIALCSFAENIVIVTLCWGLLLGVGNGLSLVTTTFLSWHYKNDTSVANGISLAGGSIGGIVYTILSKIFMDRYHLPGTFLLVSAITLHSVPAAMLLSYSRYPQKTLNRKKCFENELTEKNENLPKVTYQKGIFGISFTCKNEDLNKDEKSIYTISYSNVLPSHKNQIKPPDLKSMEISSQKADLYNSSLPIINDLQEMPKQTVKVQAENHTSRLGGSSEFNSEGYGEDMYKKENSVNYILSKNRKEDVFMDLKEVSLCETPIHKQKKKAYESFRLFYEPVFILITFLHSSFLGLILLLFTTLGEYMVDKGFTMNDVAVVLVWCNVAELFGQISLGCVADRGFMSLSNFGALLYIVIGICIVVIALSTELIGLNIAFFIGSVVSGGLASLCPAMISENFDGDLKTMALSSRFILFIPISFTAPLLIGYFRENMGSYVEMYYYIAAFCGTSALLTLLLPSLQKCRRIKPNA